MSLFSGLEGFGIKGFNKEELFRDPSVGTSAGDKEEAKKQVKEVKEEDLIFDKTYQCPVCDKKITAKAVKAGKMRTVGQDADLRMRYDLVDPYKYGVVVCNHCGYATLNRYMNGLTTSQIKAVKTNISDAFKELPDMGEVYSYDDALLRHKLALACAQVKNAKNSEKAYICLLMAWILRGKYENEECEDRALLQAEEKEAIESAYNGFKLAVSSESFPICGMDEMTLYYLIAELAHQLKDYREAAVCINRILASKTVSERIKDKARNLKEEIKIEVKRGQV